MIAYIKLNRQTSCPPDGGVPVPVNTRVGVFRRRSSDRLSSGNRDRSMFAPGSRVCEYKTASGLGDWPSRDPMGEQGGDNIYGFVLNNPIMNYDMWGFIACPITEEEVSSDVLNPPNPKRKGWHIVADTSVQFNRTITPKSCACGWKMEYCSTCKAVIRYLKPISVTKKSTPTATGDTVEQHEMVHYANGVSVYTDIDNEYKAMAGKCIKTACYNATLAYLVAYEKAQSKYLDYLNDSWDATDYLPGTAKNQENIQAGDDLDSYSQLNYDMEQANSAATAACAGN